VTDKYRLRNTGKRKHIIIIIKKISNILVNYTVKYYREKKRKEKKQKQLVSL